MSLFHVIFCIFATLGICRSFCIVYVSYLHVSSVGLSRSLFQVSFSGLFFKSLFQVSFCMVSVSCLQVSSVGLSRSLFQVSFSFLQVSRDLSLETQVETHNRDLGPCRSLFQVSSSCMQVSGDLSLET